jgi:hypothetical protein
VKRTTIERVLGHNTVTITDTRENASEIITFDEVSRRWVHRLNCPVTLQLYPQYVRRAVMHIEADILQEIAWRRRGVPEVKA